MSYVHRELGVERDLSGKLLASRVQSVKQYQQQISLLQVCLFAERYQCSYCLWFQEKVSSLEASLVTVVREFDEEREKQASLMQRLLQEARYVPFLLPSPQANLSPSPVRRQSLSVAVPTARLQNLLMYGAWLAAFWNRGQRSNTSCWRLFSR